MILLNKTFVIKNRILISIRLANELWHSKLQSGNERTMVLGIEVEQDKDDPSMKVYLFTFLGLVLGFAFMEAPPIIEK